MSFCIYKHTCPNGKVYIGVTSQNPLRRWNNGNGYRGNEHFYRAIVNYGWENIKHEILLVGMSKEQAERAEKELIAAYKSKDKEYGYNIMFETHNIYHHAPESIEKMRAAKLGKVVSEETRRKMSESRKGRTVTDETREKISLAQRGIPRKPHTDEWKTMMREMFSGENNPNYGKAMSAEQKQKISLHTKNKRPVAQKTIGGEIIKVYPSAKQAERETGIFNGNIIACCKKKKPTMGGYKWEYAEGM